MEVHHQFVAPSQCSDSLSCYFTNNERPNLIVAKHTVLQVFDILETSHTDDAHVRKLVLVAEYQLSGLITGMAKVRTLEDDKLDYLIIATKFAKISVIKWSFHLNSISTVSLHYYEPQFEALSIDKLSTARFRSDPTGQVACLESNGIFAFLPFEQEMDDDDIDYDGDKKSKEPNGANGTSLFTGKDIAAKKLTGSSFLLDARKLEANISTLVDFTFLHSYREPTVAVLHSSSPVTWAGYLPKIKDNLRLSVLSLDLESKSATTIIEASNLPYDIERAIALPAPLNGTLLIGCNEIIHVNSLGSLRGITVNEFASKCTNLQLKDQSSLNLQLEGAIVAPLVEDKVLLITATGEFYVCVFERMGGASSISLIVKVPQENYAGILLTHPVSATVIEGTKSMFVVCHGGESVLLDWQYGSGSAMSLAKAGVAQITDNEKADIDDDSYLYADDDTLGYDQSMVSNDLLDASKLKFFKSDWLANFGPLSNFTIGKVSTTKKFFGLANPNLDEDCLIGCSGIGKSSSLSIFHPSIQPTIRSTLKFSSINRMWTLNDKHGKSHYLVTSDFSNYKTQIFLINKNYRDFASKDFNTKEITVAISVVSGSSRGHKHECIVQVTSTNVFLYDFKFRKLQTISYDEEITFAQIGDDGYVLITRENGDIDVLEYTERQKEIEEAEPEVEEPAPKRPRRGRKAKNSEPEQEKAEETAPKKVKIEFTYSMEKIELPMLLNNTIIVSGYVTLSRILHKVKIGDQTVERHASKNPTPCFFLVTADNRILVFDKHHRQKIFELNTAEQLTEYLSIDLMMANKEGVPDPFFKQIMVTQLGDQFHKDDYLIILTMGGELFLYKIFFDKDEGVFMLMKMNEQCRMPITGAPDNAYSYGTHIERRLVKVDSKSYSAVFVTGVTPYCIWKSHNSSPRVFQFTAKPALAFGGFSTEKVVEGIMFIDDSKNARICELDTSFDYTNTVPVKQIPIGQTMRNVVYHSLSNTYMISTMEEVPFELKDIEGEKAASLNEEIETPTATSLKGYLKLLSPSNWSVIDQIDLEDNEIAMSVKSLNLDVVRSATMTQFKDRKEIIVAGTGIFETESTFTNGSLKIFDIIDIVPEPGRPEAKNKIKQLFSETRKGATVTVSEVSGRILAVQGQRAFVWNLKNDNNVVPVAFVDTGIWTTETKSFQNLILFGDTQQSVSLVGFEAEPYRIVQLGKDIARVDVLATDFLVHDGNLYILVADANQVLHILQYDPEDPASHQGHRLIRKSVFRNNSSTTNLVAVARSKSLFSASRSLKENLVAEFECIGSNVDGSLYRVTPVSETTYRRLYAVQQQIYDRESHFLGLNPRLNIIGHMENIMDNVNRPVLDFDVLKKFMTLSEERKRAFAKRIGNNVYSEIYRDFIGIS
ncbi:unnamed protein product [Kuraishia capsulata CBS 1993]|uniref:Uncharacterized protein n=1 Tax=Kuraishia capsulata CBS 1993 TaxID=1382522 RepID=W6MLQ2_9ASCO|nr:uncharacterized protein KUCA_T00003409001 [Kuraishia capsulata CBS 1993]CDK27431.1 unnamed protein product [Kuraishia capsulata CBS 1993]